MKKLILIIIGMFSFISAQTVPNLPIPICAGTAEVVNDTLYFFGGGSRWYLSATRYQAIYQYNGNTWNVYDSIPDNNTWGMESVVIGDDVYLFAGHRFGARYVRKYNVPTKTWTTLNLSPNLLTFGPTFEYVNNHIYMVLRSGEVYEYDLTNDTWQSKTANSIPGYTLSSTVYQDEIYVVGFYDSTFSHPFYKYAPATDSWTQLANIPYQVAKCAMEVIGNKIYCVGGSIQGNPSEQYDSLLVYDIVSDTWSIDQFELSSKRVWMADVTYNNKFYVLGGLDTTGFAVNIVEEIVPEGPLPVELISFTADVRNNEVELNWTTATEVNNYGFEIQRSNSNKEIWEKIYFVEGHGNSNSPQKYSFIDRNVVPGIISYRLKQIDFDGSFEYSREIRTEVTNPQEFSLSQNHPNPFNPSTRVRYQISKSGYVILSVYDLLGNEIAKLVDDYKPAGKYNVNFNGTGLASGIYYYKLQTNDFVKTKKMLLLK